MRGPIYRQAFANPLSAPPARDAYHSHVLFSSSRLLFLVEMLNSSTFLLSFYCFVGQQAIKPPRCTGAAVTALPSGRLTPRVCVAAVCGGVCRTPVVCLLLMSDSLFRFVL